MTDTLHDDADDLLHWLDAHSVSISDGIPFSLMQQKWIASQRPYPQLRSGLEWLFGQQLLSMTPGLDQPHVRLTGKGFEQLLKMTDSARVPPATATPEPAPTVQPAVAVPAPATFNPPPLPVAAVTPASAPPMVMAPAIAAAPPSRFVDPAKQPTEIGLRNQILTIFRDLKLVAGQQLIAMTLTRYWQEMGQRGEHLRAGIDVMLRDHYLEPAVKRYENYWMLTAEGHAYLAGPISHPALLALAQPLRRVEESQSDEKLRAKALGLFRSTASVPFVTLESSWRLSRDSLIHALDLLIKSGDLQLAEHEPLHFELTASGARRR